MAHIHVRRQLLHQPTYDTSLFLTHDAEYKKNEAPKFFYSSGTIRERERDILLLYVMKNFLIEQSHEKTTGGILRSDIHITILM